jgi:hypothetical protein
MQLGRVRKVPKMYYLNVWNAFDPIVEAYAVVRHFRHLWVLMRKIWQEMCENLKILEN